MGHTQSPFFIFYVWPLIIKVLFNVIGKVNVKGGTYS